jgi:uncharacterized protein with PQ loop repeat
MNLNTSDLIAWAFFIANGGRILAYIPQLVAAWKCENGAKSVSRMTWSYFAFAHLTGILYGQLVIHNSQMALVFTGNFLVCCLLVGIVSWKKHTYAMRRGHAPDLKVIVGSSPRKENRGQVQAIQPKQKWA